MKKFFLKLFLSWKYDQLYKKLNKLIELENPCKITCSGCLKGSDFCCKACKYLGEKGCTVKALTCKTWFCDSAQVSPKLRKELEAVLREMHHYALYYPRGSKEDSIKQALKQLL